MDGGRTRANHLGYFPANLGPESTAARDIVSLLDAGAWLKLSGAFRVSETADWSDTVAIAQAFIAAAPDRCVWGSDWPHVNFWKPMPRMGALLDLLAQWEPDAVQRDRILVDNPRGLYRFDEAGHA